MTQYCPAANDCLIKTLQGSWFFSKGTLLEAADIIQQAPDSTKLTHLPATWNAEPLQPFASQWQEAKDLGTYWLFVAHPPQDLAIHLQGIFSNYRLIWFDLEEKQSVIERAQQGWEHKNPQDSTAFLREQIIPLTTQPGSSHYLLVIQVINSVHSKGGIRSAPRIGPYPQISEDVFRKNILHSAITGALLLVAFYHFLIYNQRREDKASMFLGWECLLLAIYGFCRNGLLEYIFSTPSDFLLKVRTQFEYLTNLFGPLAFYGFLASAFPKVHVKSIFFGLLAVTVGGFLLSLTPLNFFTRFYLQVYVPGVVMWIVFIFYRTVAVAKHYSDLKTILGGISLLGIAILHDTLANSGVINSFTSDLTPLAQLCFVFFQGALISRRFASAHQTAHKLSIHLQKEVDRQTRDIRSIMETINQGIFTVYSDQLLVGKQRSYHLEHFCIDAQKKHLAEFLLNQYDISSDQKSQIKEVLSSAIGNDEITFITNQHLLPKEIKKQGHDQLNICEIDWTPVYDQNDLIESFLICLRDVTELRKLQEKNRRQEEDIKILEELLRIPEERFKRFIFHVKHYLAENKILIDGLSHESGHDQKQVIRQLFMNIHTIKGNARNLHLEAIAEAAHQVEQYYASLQQKTLDIHIPTLNAGLSEINGVIDRYQEFSQDKLGWSMNEEFLKIPRSLILEACQYFAGMTMQAGNSINQERWRKLDHEFHRSSRAELCSLIEDLCRGIESMARDLHKMPPQIHMNIGPIYLTDAGTRLLTGVLNHIIRNAIDHGLETQSEREALGKNPQGSISFQTSLEGEFLHLSVIDNGQGLLVEKLWNKAVSLNLRQGQMPTDPAIIAQLVFEPGLSTKESATEISGRGVGMDAIRNYLRQTGGDAFVNLLPANSQSAGIPFELVLIIHREFWWMREHELSQVDRNSA